MKSTELMMALALASQAQGAGRERLNFDAGWRFALGHPSDAEKDHGHGKRYFSYYAKAGYGDGPADPKFDDRAWRELDLPHDWAVELPFAEKASYSHGFKTIGREFPETSVGWYRKTFELPGSDKGRRISLQLDGVHRDAKVWVNGFYMGREESGYVGVSYDLTEVANFGGRNVVAVRADASYEEGWFYEGAGIYRHVWLSKTAPLHFEQDGIFVAPTLANGKANLKIETRIRDHEESGPFAIEHRVLSPSGKEVGHVEAAGKMVPRGDTRDLSVDIQLPAPELWELENPRLYTLVSRIVSGGKAVDELRTAFGLRELRFDADQGLFVNGRHLKVQGVNQHQDHAGVGTAIPDALQEWRVLKLKEIGVNAIRCAHHPPTPELLDICDRLGVLVIDENRLMGAAQEQMKKLEWLLRRDRNHPSVLAWSIGNEEWAIEGNERGARIGAPMQALVKRLDPTRPVTVAMSGGLENGTGQIIELAGFNYFTQGNADDYHKKFPQTFCIGTEETTSQSTRGVYVTDKALGHHAPIDRDKPAGVEVGWRYYMERPFLAGLFWWTGFDYKGEPHPYGWPQVASQFGVLDSCGFDKDPAQYLRAWWKKDPYVGIAPHWNWGKAGELIDVWVRANTEEVELLLNGQSLGTKKVEKLGHLEWKVPYAPGSLQARGISAGKEVAGAKVETSGPAVSVVVRADKAALYADGRDLAVVELGLVDAKGDPAVLADNELQFELKGPGRILGVGNGDPASHEADTLIDEFKEVRIGGLKALATEAAKTGAEIQVGFDDSGWKEFAYKREEKSWGEANVVVRGSFELDEPSLYSELLLLPKAVLDEQEVYVNGVLLFKGQTRQGPSPEIPLQAASLKKGKNVWAVFGKPMLHQSQWDDRNTDAGVLKTVKAARPWSRKAFNGLAQLLLQAGTKAGTLELNVTGAGLRPASLKIKVEAKK